MNKVRMLTKSNYMDYKAFLERHAEKISDDPIFFPCIMVYSTRPNSLGSKDSIVFEFVYPRDFEMNAKEIAAYVDEIKKNLLDI